MRRATAVVLAGVALSGVACDTLREKVMERFRDGGPTAATASAAAVVPPPEAVLTPLPPPGRAAAPAPEVHVPDDFPAAVPLYPQSKLKAATVAERDGKRAHVLLFETADKGAAIADFYRAQLKGWKQTVDLTVGPTRRIELGSDKQQLDVALSITQSADHAAAELSVVPRGSKTE